MSEVLLKIGGQNYTLMCADGQEQELQDLSKLLDERVSAVKAGGGVSEALGLVMAGLLITNDLNEAKAALEKLEEEKGRPPISKEVLDQLLLAVEKASKRVSGVAQTIERH